MSQKNEVLKLLRQGEQTIAGLNLTQGVSMREIKFRGWIPEILKYADRCTVYCDGSYSLSIDQWVEEYKCNGEVDGYDGVIEQYTGLKDKNGVEIYEGDIVRWEHGGFYGTANVEWCNTNPSMLLNGNYVTPDREFEDWIEYDFDKCGTMVLEVIGNIHKEQQ